MYLGWKVEINLQVWLSQGALFSSLRLQQPPGSSSPRTIVGEPAETPAPWPRSDALRQAADSEPGSGILSSRTVPR